MKARRQNLNNGRKTLIILGSAFIALFLTFFLFKGFPPAFVGRTVLYVTEPFLSLKNKASFFLTDTLAVFRSKQELQRENDSLKEKLAGFRVKEQLFGSVSRENQEFKNILSRRDLKSLILASVILKSGYGDYNFLVIDAGSNDGVKAGMAVTAFGDVLLGYIADVAPDSSRVKLVSYPGRETNVYIQGQDFSPGLSAIGVGLGGENMEITLPGDIEIAEGRNITTFDTSPLLLGAVEKIVRKPADPFQKIIFHLSINIQELNHVYIIK